MYNSKESRAAGAGAPARSLAGIAALRERLLKTLAVFLIVGAALPNAASANAIQDENAKPGNPEWEWFPWAENNEIEGYASRVSVRGGQSIDFFVNVRDTAAEPTYTFTIYRLGWYGGAGARQVLAPVSKTSIQQALPTPNALGMIAANWTSPIRVAIPRNWTSGIYVATVVANNSGMGRYIPFVVAKDYTYTDYLFQAGVTTWQAYNGWGGKSLYPFNSTNGEPARKVSFNRPYQNAGGLGDLKEWELNMLRFLEKEGYDVSYQTDIDTDNDFLGTNLLFHRAILSVGHDEYWTANMRNNFEFARDHGVSLGFFAANVSFWQIRMEDNDRTIVGYKYFAPTEDPYATDASLRNDKYITTQWRLAPVNNPENAMMGIMYSIDPVDGDIVITNAAHWVFSNTGLQNGDVLPGLLGYEIDTYFDNGKAPGNVEILAHSPAPGTDVYGDMSIYTKNCRSFPCITRQSVVFATGSMQWNWGLDRFGHSRNLENCAAKQITRNVLARFAGDPLPAAPACTNPTVAAPTVARAMAFSLEPVAAEAADVSIGQQFINHEWETAPYYSAD